jgi:hypothetical protein
MILVLEDVGDCSPIPSDEAHNSSHVEFTWRRVMRSLSRVHHAARKCPERIRHFYGGALPRRSFPDISRLVRAIGEATSRWCQCAVSCGTLSTIEGSLESVTAVLRKYMADHGGYSIGERSCANIRLTPERVCHIDHCSKPGYVPHADLVSVWASPHRRRLVDVYVQERTRLDQSFATEPFFQSDRAFSLLNSLLWLAVKCGSWPDDKVRPQAGRGDVVVAAQMNIRCALRAACALDMGALSDCLRALQKVWSVGGKRSI